MEIVEFPTSIRFRPYKSPCKSVSFMFGGMYENVCWERGDSELTPIGTSEFNKFLNDSLDLLDLLTNIHVADWDKKIMNKIKTYWLTWGPLYPSKSNQISLKSLMDMGQWFFLTQVFWRNRKIPAPAVQMLCEDILRNSDINLSDETDIKYWRMEYWPSENTIMSFPLHEVPSDNFNFAIEVSDVPTKDTPIDEQVEWLRNMVRRKASDIISTSRVYLKAIPETEVDTISFIGETDNLFLTYLLNAIVFTEGPGEPCACGCGRIVPSHRKKFARDKCAQHNKDCSPRRKIKNWLKSPLHYNGGLTIDEFNQLMGEVDKLLQQGKSENEIKNIIQPKVDLAKQKKKGGKR